VPARPWWWVARSPAKAASYTYAWTTPNGQFASPTNTPTATVDRPGDYGLLVRDTLSFCSATARVTIGIDTLHPTVVAVPDAVLDCSAPTITLDASAAVQPGLDATWSGACIVANPAAGIAQIDCTGQYVLTLTDTANGCTSTDTVVVNVNRAFPVAALLAPDTLTCLRTEVMLDGSGSTPAGLLRFEWSAPAQATQPGSATTSQSGTVSLMVERTDNFCRDTMSITVVQDTLSPVADAGPDVVLNCYAGSRTVGGSNTAQGPFFRYQWREEGLPIPSATSDTLVVGQSANLRLEVTDIRNGCVGSDSVTVSEDFFPPEQVEAGPNALLNCANDLVQLLPDSTRFSQPVTWAWSGSCVDAVPGEWALSTNCPGVYTLTVTNVSNGCSGQSTAEVGVSETFSQAMLVPNATLSCETGMATLDNSGSIGTLYRWLRDGEIVSLPNASPVVSQPGVYTLITSDFENICSDTAQTVVAWACQPTLNLFPLDTLTCTQQSVILGLEAAPLVGAHTYEWTAPANGCFVGSNTTAQVEVVCAGTYQVAVTHTLSGQRSTATVVVAIDTLAPIVDAGMNQLITCTDTVAHLTANVQGGNLADYLFTWTNFAEDPLAQGAAFSTQMGGTYFLLAENLRNGCTGRDAVQVAVNNAAPTISFGSTVFPCAQDTFRVRAFVSPLLAGNHYQWSGPGIVADADSTGVLVNTAGNYTLHVERTDNGCTATATVAVTQQSCVPCLDLSPVDTLDCIRTEVFLQAAFCEPCPGCTLQWSDANGNIAAANMLELRVDAPGAYTLTATDVSGFQSTVTAQVLQFNSPPALDLGDDRNLTCDSTTVQLANTLTPFQTALRYEWQLLEDPAFIHTDTTLITAVAGTYVLTLFDEVFGCVARDTLLVGIDTLPPMAEAGPDQLLTCTTSAVVLDGGGSTLGGVIYQWSGPSAACLSGANTLNPLATCAGLYTLLVEAPNGCMAEDTVRVTTSNALPQLTPLPDAVLTCAMPSVTLSAAPVAGGGNYDYRWCPVNALGEDISNLCSIGLGRTVAQPGRFRFTATNTLTDCSSNFIVQVSIDTLPPAVDAGVGQTLLCNTTQLQLNATAEPGSYLWADADGNPLEGGTTLMPTVTEPGWYFLSVIADDNGCAAADSVLIAQDVRTPQLDAGADTRISCAQPTAILSAMGSISGNTPQWLWTTPDGNITQNATTPQPTVAAAGTYIVRLTDPATGCVALDTVVVQGDFASPQAIVAGADLLVLDCRQDTLLLDALPSVGSTGQPLAWAWVALGTGRLFPTTDTPQVFTDRPGSYRLVVEDTGNGCRDTLLLNVASDRQTLTTVVQTPAALDCQTTSVTLQPQAPADTDGYTFRWLDAAGTLLGNGFTQTVTDAGWYFLAVENIRNGCISSDSVQVTSTIERPGVSIAPPQPISCTNASVQLNGSASAQGMGFSSQWTTPDGTLEGNTQSPTATAAAAGNYTLTVLNTQNGCDSSATVTVLASGTFITGVTLDTVQPNCQGEQLGSISIEEVAGGTPPYLYSLEGSSFSMNPFFEDLPIGSYTLTVRDGAGCAWVQEVGIVAPTALTLDLGPDVTIQLGASITLSAEPSHPVSSWRWVAAPLLGGQAPLVATVSPLESQYVVLTAVDGAGCTAADTLRITVEKRRRLFLPDVFSPNGDGNNDTFTVFADQEVVIVNHLRIYNRWGGMVFERTDFAPNNPTLGWDGLLAGQPLNTAVFVYSFAVTYRDGRTEWLTGEVVLMR
jgi:gliding motility-associated-like protein